MKPRLILVSIFPAILSAGCTLQSLTPEESGPLLGSALGVESTDFQFLNHCGFKEVPETQKGGFKLDQGIIALTDSHIWLVRGNLETPAKSDAIKIPLSEIKGVSQMPSQIQLKRDDKLIVMRMYGMFRYEIDPVKSGEFRDLLAMADIPKFEATNTYGFERPNGPIQSPFAELDPYGRAEYSSRILDHPNPPRFETEYPTSTGYQSTGMESQPRTDPPGGTNKSYP